MYREKEDVCSGMTPRAVAFVYESDHHAALVDTPGQGQGKWCWMRVVGGTEREGGRETERERDFIRDVVHITEGPRRCPMTDVMRVGLTPGSLME